MTCLACKCSPCRPAPIEQALKTPLAPPALPGRDCGSQLVLRGIEGAGGAHLEALLAALADVTCELTALTYAQGNIGGELRRWTKMLPRGAPLVFLDLSGQRLCDDSLEALLEAATPARASLPHLTTLLLNHNPLGAGPRSDAVPAWIGQLPRGGAEGCSGGGGWQLQRLGLRDTWIDDRSIAKLSAALGTAPALTTLELQWNDGVGEEQARLLGAAWVNSGKPAEGLGFG